MVVSMSVKVGALGSSFFGGGWGGLVAAGSGVWGVRLFHSGGARVDQAARRADIGAGWGDVPVVSIDDLSRTAHSARVTIDIRTLTFDVGALTSDLAPLPSHYATRNIDQAPRRIDAKK